MNQPLLTKSFYLRQLARCKTPLECGIAYLKLVKFMMVRAQQAYLFKDPTLLIRS